MLKSKIEKFLNVVTGYLNELEFKVPDVDRNIGRILSIFGIDLNQRKSNETGSLWSIRAYVAELEDPGTSPKNPYLPAEFDKTDAVAVRKEIYKYYLKRLNLSGHRAGEVL